MHDFRKTILHYVVKIVARNATATIGRLPLGFLLGVIPVIIWRLISRTTAKGKKSPNTPPPSICDTQGINIIHGKKYSTP